MELSILYNKVSAEYLQYMYEEDLVTNLSWPLKFGL